MQSLSFQPHNLVVDYLSFNIQGFVDPEPIAEYLFQKCNFNSTIAYDRIDKPLKYDKKNRYKVSFRQQEYDPKYKSFWGGTQMIFSGQNAAQFYRLIKAQKI